MFSLGKEQNPPVSPPTSNPETNRSSRVKPKQVILNCHGLASEAFFNKGTNELDPLNIKIIACSDTDKNLSNFLKEHTNAKSYGDMRDFVNAVMEDPKLKEELRYPDILFTTAPCQGRSVLHEENGIDPKVEYTEDDLFFLQLVLIQLLEPKRVISEMTPPNRDFHADHYAIALEMERLGYEVSVTDRFPSDLCGDVQHRERWVMIDRKKAGNKLHALLMTSHLYAKHLLHSLRFWTSLKSYPTAAG